MAKRSVAHYLCCEPPIGAAGLERGVISEHKLVLMNSLSIWGVLARFWRVLVQGIGQVYVNQVVARFPHTSCTFWNETGLSPFWRLISLLAIYDLFLLAQEKVKNAC